MDDTIFLTTSKDEEVKTYLDKGYYIAHMCFLGIWDQDYPAVSNGTSIVVSYSPSLPLFKYVLSRNTMSRKLYG